MSSERDPVACRCLKGDGHQESMRSGAGSDCCALPSCPPMPVREGGLWLSALRIQGLGIEVGAALEGLRGKRGHC